MNDYYGAPNDYRNYVQHFGVKGMHWGIRRYQNPDGTLTPEGRKRYGSEDAFRYEQLKKKNRSKMSNAELKELADRTELMRKTDKLTDKQKEIRMNAIMSLTTTAIKVAAVAVGIKYLHNHLPEIMASLSKTTTQSAVNVVKEASKVVSSEAKNTAHNVRRSVAQTNFARNYVKTFEKLTHIKR